METQETTKPALMTTDAAWSLLTGDLRDEVRDYILSEHDLEERFEQMLDDCHESVKICGYEYAPSRALKEVDPTAYHQEFLSWLDSERGETIVPLFDDESVWVEIDEVDAFCAEIIESGDEGLKALILAQGYDRTVADALKAAIEDAAEEAQDATQEDA